MPAYFDNPVESLLIKNLILPKEQAHRTQQYWIKLVSHFFKQKVLDNNNSDLYFVPFKDNDIMEANVSLGELQQKIKRLEGLCQVSTSNLFK